jgi:hypothetical protein
MTLDFNVGKVFLCRRVSIQCRTVNAECRELVLIKNKALCCLVQRFTVLSIDGSILVINILSVIT